MIYSRICALLLAALRVDAVLSLVTFPRACESAHVLVVELVAPHLVKGLVDFACGHDLGESRRLTFVMLFECRVAFQS